MNNEHKQVGWIFAVWWTGLTIVGGLIGNYAVETLLARFQNSGTVWNILLSLLGSGVFGLMVSASQWILLRRYISKSIWWIVTGTAGRASGALLGYFVWTLATSLGSQSNLWLSLSLVIIRAAVLGSFQWLFLRQFHTQTGWWVLGNGIGWMFGPMIASLFPAITRFDFVIQTMVVTLAGIITGILMTWILKQPIPEKNNDQISTNLWLRIGIFAGILPGLLFAVIAWDSIFGFGGAFCFGSLGIPLTLIGAYIGRKSNKTAWIGAVLGMVL